MLGWKLFENLKIKKFNYLKLIPPPQITTFLGGYSFYVNYLNFSCQFYISLLKWTSVSY